MKLGVIIEDTVSAGGGFNQALNALLQMQRMSKGRFEYLVFTNRTENISTLSELGLEPIVFKTNFIDKLIGYLAQSSLGRRIIWRFKFITPFEKLLLKNNCDLVYFVAPSERVTFLQVLNFIITVWDDCHRDFPEFPEVRMFGEFIRRENLYKFLPRAYLTIVDSEELAIRLHSRYGVDLERLLVIPFRSNPLLKIDQFDNAQKILKEYALKPSFFLYPAQYWPHKNHIRIIQALSILKKQGENPIFVFVGGDKGNKNTVLKAVLREGLQKQVVDLGFVPNEHLQILYKNCAAVVMPTYFGPTNIPPLEAWQFGRPLIYSHHLAKQCGEAALLVDPDDAQSLANAILQCKNENVANNLIKLGNIRLHEIEKTLIQSEENFIKKLKAFEKRLSTWTL